MLQRLDARLRLLAEPRRAPERHQTLRRAVGWSYDLLDDVERCVLMRCAVFAGGFDLAGGVSVCGLVDLDEPALLDVMDSLVRKSLATAERGLDAPRYGMLETVRQFAEDELASTRALDEVRDRHAQFFADQVVAQFDVWDGPRQRDALDWVDAELANLRAAFRWTVGRSELDVAAAVAAHTAMMAMPLQRYEPVARREEVLGHASAAELRELPRVLTGATFCVFSGRAEDAVDHARAVVALETDPRYDAFAADGRPSASSTPSGTSVGRSASWRSAPTSPPSPGWPTSSASVASSSGSTPSDVPLEARALAPDAVRAARDYGNPFLVVHGAQRDPDGPSPRPIRSRPGSACARPSSTRGTTGCPTSKPSSPGTRPDSRPLHDDLHEALSLLDAAFERLQTAGADATLSQSLTYLAVVFERCARAEVAATVYGASETNGGLHAVIDLPETLANLRVSLGDVAFDRCVGDGAAMDLADAVAYARGQIRDARAAPSEPNGSEPGDRRGTSRGTRAGSGHRSP